MTDLRNGDDLAPAGKNTIPYLDKNSNEQVRNPKHYDVGEDLTVIETMARTSTRAEFNGFCRNTALKYRLRAGKKGTGTVHQDLAKADEYGLLFDEYVQYCIPDDEFISEDELGSLLNLTSEVTKP